METRPAGTLSLAALSASILTRYLMVDQTTGDRVKARLSQTFSTYEEKKGERDKCDAALLSLYCWISNVLHCSQLQQMRKAMRTE